MKLIIDIYEEQYEFIKQGMSIKKVMEYPALMNAICEYISNGIPLDEIRTELHATAEMHEDENYYLREEWIDEIIDKYKVEREDKG